MHPAAKQGSVQEMMLERDLGKTTDSCCDCHSACSSDSPDPTSSCWDGSAKISQPYAISTPNN